MPTRVCFRLATVFCLFTLPALGDEQETLDIIPPEQRVPNFYSRVVTGPLMNQSVCFVCRNGNRPTVMVLARELTPELKLFLRNVDRIVDQRRVSGLKCFAVYVTDKDSLLAVSATQTFAFEGKLKCPLAVASDEIAGPGCLDIEDDAEIAVVLYHRRKVIQKHSFGSGQLTKEEMRTILQEIGQLANEEPLADEEDAEDS